jgi:hypothetical protein
VAARNSHPGSKGLSLAVNSHFRFSRKGVSDPSCCYRCRRLGVLVAARNSSPGSDGLSPAITSHFRFTGRGVSDSSCVPQRWQSCAGFHRKPGRTFSPGYTCTLLGLLPVRPEVGGIAH